MKIRRLFESKYNTDFFQNSKLEDYFEEEQKFKHIKENMLNLIKEFVELNKEYFMDEYGIKSEDIDGISVEENPNNIVVKIMDGDWGIYLINDDFEKLVNFINEPEIYKNQNKFNL
jgi:hypothetical protein